MYMQKYGYICSEAEYVKDLASIDKNNTDRLVDACRDWIFKKIRTASRHKKRKFYSGNSTRFTGFVGDTLHSDHYYAMVSSGHFPKKLQWNIISSILSSEHVGYLFLEKGKKFVLLADMEVINHQ